MTLKELFDVTTCNSNITVTTCGKHGGCLVMDTPAFIAFCDLRGKGSCEVKKIKVAYNTMEITIGEADA